MHKRRKLLDIAIDLKFAEQPIVRFRCEHSSDLKENTGGRTCLILSQKRDPNPDSDPDLDSYLSGLGANKLQVAREALVEEQLAPVVHGHQVPEPAATRTQATNSVVQHDPLQRCMITHRVAVLGARRE